MSDLCYNCGDCHLPRPCIVLLKLCEICGNLGHTYNFCPKGVRLRDPNYQFWALCHNCDRWHLPDPCLLEFHKCEGCGHGGHKQFFCPIKPVSRAVLINEQDGDTGVKRKRTSGSDVSEGGQPQLTADIIQKIKVDTTIKVINLLSNGYQQEDILRFMADPVHASVYANVYAAGNGTTQNRSMPNTPTPAQQRAAPRSMQSEGTAPGLYSIMQDRFTRGDLDNTQTQRPAQSYQTPYADTFIHTGGSGHQAGGNGQVSDDNIHVGTASPLQELAHNANVGSGATSADASGSIVTTADSSNLNLPTSQAQSFSDHLANTLTATVAEYKPGVRAMASAALNQGVTPANTTTPENMLPFHTHTMPQQTPEETITVGTPQPEEPPLKLNKDGKPSKRQPARKTKKT